MVSQITRVSIVCSTVYSGVDQRKLKGPRHWHRGPVTQKLFQFDDVIMNSRETVFTYNVSLSCQIVLKYCTAHVSIIVVLYVSFQNDLITEMDIVGERDFPRIQFKMGFGRMVYIAMSPLIWSAWAKNMLSDDTSNNFLSTR